MHLILTSAGIKTAAIALAVRDRLRTVVKLRAVMLTCRLGPLEIPYVEEAEEELRTIGITDVDVVVLSNPRTTFPARPDLVYVCGGNTFHILEAMRRNGWLPMLRTWVEQGTVYLGVSAGSIIAGPDIQIAGWGRIGDQNDIGLKDLEALHLTDTIIFPHFEAGLADEVAAFTREKGIAVETLTDQQALVVTAQGVHRIG